MQIEHFEGRVDCQQVTEMIEQTIGLTWSAGLREFGVVTPGIKIGRWDAGRDAGTFLCDEKLTHGCQKVRVLAIASIDNMYVALPNGEFSQEKRCSFYLAFIW